jgi:hypothetical protein
MTAGIGAQSKRSVPNLSALNNLRGHPYMYPKPYSRVQLGDLYSRACIFNTMASPIEACGRVVNVEALDSYVSVYTHETRE